MEAADGGDVRGGDGYTRPVASVSSERLEVVCSSCGARLVVGPEARTARCAYCDSPYVVDRRASADRPDPVFAIPFTVGADDAATRLRRWLERRHWAPSALRRAAADRVRGVYLPAYLYSATSATRYSAVIGEDYYETRIRGKSTRRVKKSEHRTLEGRHACYLSDVLVTASAGIPNRELERVEPFDLGGLRRYDAKLLAGWHSEEPSLSGERCLDLGRQEARAGLEPMLRRFMPGDSCEELRFHAELGDETIDLTLVPLWVFALRYREDRPPVRVLVNGQSGKVAGVTPVSWLKIAVAVAIGLLGLLGGVAALLGWLG